MNMVSFVRVSVLLWADILAGYALWVMMTYLTNVWQIKFTRAATIVNVFRGAAAIMPIGMSFFVDAFTSDYWMLLISSLAYSFGMYFLAMSTPPFLSKTVGNCGEYKSECIGDTQKFLFYTSLVLIAVGISGHITSLASFLNHQLVGSDWKGCIRRALNCMCNPCKLRCQLQGIFAVFFLPILGGFALPYIKPWSVRFGIPAICTVLATLLFMSGSRSYEHDPKPRGSPLTTFIRVFVASASKMSLPLPPDANLLFQKQTASRSGSGSSSKTNKVLPHTNSLRWLDKAAIVVDSIQTSDQNRWKLCTVTEVEETKKFVRRIPMWITFIICGIVTSIGGTYFLEQANHMNRTIIAPFKVPLPILLIFYDSTKVYFTKVYVCFAKLFIPKGVKIYTPAIGIGVSMLISILCCITASKVETRRLGSFNAESPSTSPSPKVSPNEISPMSMFWLLPQFLLLGASDGISSHSIDSFFKDQVAYDSFFKDQVAYDSFFKDQFPASMIRSFLNYTYGVLGLGFMGGVLSVYVVTQGVLGLGYIAAVLSVNVVGKVSEMGKTKKSWFQHSINDSRLDNYYWTLAVLSCVNLFFYIFVSIWYAYHHQNPPPTKDNIEEANPEQQPGVPTPGGTFLQVHKHEDQSGIEEQKHEESVGADEGDGRCCCFCCCCCFSGC